MTEDEKGYQEYVAERRLYATRFTTDGQTPIEWSTKKPNRSSEPDWVYGILLAGWAFVGLYVLISILGVLGVIIYAAATS